MTYVHIVGEKPYECGICGKRFIQSCDKKRHEATHGLQSNPAPRRVSLYEMANGLKEKEVEDEPAHLSVVKDLIQSARSMGVTVTMPGETDARTDTQTLDVNVNMMGETDKRTDMETLGVNVAMAGEMKKRTDMKTLNLNATMLAEREKRTDLETLGVKAFDKPMIMHNIGNVGSEKSALHSAIGIDKPFITNVGSERTKMDSNIGSDKSITMHNISKVGLEKATVHNSINSGKSKTIHENSSVGPQTVAMHNMGMVTGVKIEEGYRFVPRRRR